MLMQPVDRFVGNVGGEVIALLRRFVRLDRRLIAIDARVILIVGGLKESVKMLEAQSGWPAIEGTLRAHLPGGCVMPLAKSCRAVTIHLENFGNRRGAFGKQRVVTRVGRGPFGD
jgi:hypothetical protein